MALKRKYDIVIIVALVIAAIAYGASRTEYRLQPEMPTEFFGGSNLTPKKRIEEQKIAAAYWESAVQQVQWKYGYASRLPNDPPADFSISASEFGAVARDEAVRHRYWLQLRTTWNVSNAWKTQYQWSSISFRQSLRAAGDWWAELTRNMMGR